MAAYVTFKSGLYVEFHIGTSKKRFLHGDDWMDIVSIQADGDELYKCFEILGRPASSLRVFTFVGCNAQEIAVNWH